MYYAGFYHSGKEQSTVVSLRLSVSLICNVNAVVIN